jgi:hypothetical protein
MEDRRLVQLALDYDYVTADQVARAERVQRQLADRGVERTVWFLLQDLALISDHQSRELRKHVSSSQIRALEVDGYVLEGRLGSGGMGDVFRGRNAAGEEAAIKLLSSKVSEHPENSLRFQREATATLRLRHPHITRSLGTGDVEGQLYLVMELVQGISLKQLLQVHGKVPEADVLALLWQMASALDYAWKHGVLHRDVKPANLILAPARAGVAEPFCAKLCDFGLAKVWQEGSRNPEVEGQLTGSGVAMGTPHYMAPEQASGEQDLDQRADIYSLGASVYHALIGQTLHSGKSSTVIMYKQVTERAHLSALRAIGISPGCVRLVGKMLEIDRNQRCANWGEVIEAVRLLAPAMVAAQEAALAAYGPGYVTPPAGPPATDAAAAPVAPAAVPSTAAVQAHTVRPRTSRLSAAPAPTVPAPAPSVPSGAAPAAPFSPVAADLTPSNFTPADFTPSNLTPAVDPIRRIRLLWPVLVTVLVIVATSLGAFLFLRNHRHVECRVTPVSFAAVMASADQSNPIDVVLAPGDYPGPWRFGVAHAGLTIRAAGPGVRMVGNPLDPEAALVRLEPGLTGFRLQGITLFGTASALEALAGTQATLTDLTVQGAITVSGARLTISGLQQQGPLVVEHQGELLLQDSMVQGPIALDLRDGKATVRRGWLSRGLSPATPPTAGAVVRVASGQLDLDAVVITASGPEVPALTTGIRLESGSRCTLADVAVSRVETGLEGSEAQLPLIDGLTITASGTGIRWQGQRGPEWRWLRLLLQAPQPTQGLPPLTGNGAGARPERLDQTPQQRQGARDEGRGAR